MSQPGIAYLSTPAVIVNQALDSLVGGKSSLILGDLTDGTDIAEVARRNYGQALRQLLRTAHWNFARKHAKLTLLADATGQSPEPISPYVEFPWQYAYAWPIDAVQGRWMPYSPVNGVPQTPQGLPLTTAGTQVGQYNQIPGRFLVSSSDQYPVQTGYLPWDQMPDFQRTEGVGPTNRKIILTNCCNAHFVYTRLVPVIEEWDDLFRQAMVSLMAIVLAPVAIDDPKLKLAERDRHIKMAQVTIADARVANGNESSTSQTTDFEASWMRARNWGAWGARSAFGDGAHGTLSVGFESMSFAGNVF